MYVCVCICGHQPWLSFLRYYPLYGYYYYYYLAFYLCMHVSAHVCVPSRGVGVCVGHSMCGELREQHEGVWELNSDGQA